MLEKLQWLCFKSILINYEITYDTVMKNSGACWRWVSSAPPKVLICWKPGQHSWKSAWKWRQTLLDLKNGAQGLQKITWRPFLEVTPKKVFMICKSCTKTFRESLLKFGQKSFTTPKISLLLNLWWKSTSAPVAPLLKGQGMNTPAIPPSSGVPVHINLHALSLLVVVGYNWSL